MLFLTTTHSNNCAERWNLITTATCSLVLTFYLTLHWRLTWWVRLFMFRKRSIQWPGVKRREKGRHFLHSKHFTSWSNFSIFFISEINRSPSMNAKPFSIERYVKLFKSITKKGTMKKYNHKLFFHGLLKSFEPPVMSSNLWCLKPSILLDFILHMASSQSIR